MDDFATARNSRHSRASGGMRASGDLHTARASGELLSSRASGELLSSRASGTTSSLNDVENDTGRVAFCGPYVLSAITGYPISKIERAINAYRELPPDLHHRVRGTYADEVEGALAVYGYDMTLKESYMHHERKGRPTVWNWMQKPRNAWASYILAIHKGKEGHWILIRGVKMCDTYTEGKWTFVCDGPHRGCRIMEVFEVRKSLGL